MIKILKIKKKTNAKYEIWLEDGRKITLYDDVILKYNILLKKEIKEDLLEQVQLESSEIECYQKVLQKLSKKNRSEKEIRTFLEENQIPIEIQNQYILKLKKLGYLNSNRYIEAYIHDKLLLTLEGPLKITKDLLEKGFSSVDIEETLSSISDEEWKKRVSSYIEKKLKKPMKGSVFTFKNKLSESLFQLGYSKEMTSILVEQVSFDHELNLEKDYERLFQKLSGKYSDSTLDRKIKQKLYQKGYPLEDIEAYQKNK